MLIFAGTDRGKAREINQDCYYILQDREDMKLCILADRNGWI